MNGTFIYYVELTNSATSTKTRNTYTIVMSQAFVNSVGINITLPFDIWYQLNKNSIPWYMPPRKVTSIKQTSAAAGHVYSEYLSSLAPYLDKKTVNALEKWTDSEIAEAYKESLERINSPTIPIGIDASLSSMGLLTIKFSSSVSFPSYLLR